MEYKTSYTKEEVDELLNWFSTHEFEGELDMGGGIKIPDVKVALPPMLYIVREKYEYRTFSGQIHKAFRIREELIRQNKVKP